MKLNRHIPKFCLILLIMVFSNLFEFYKTARNLSRIKLSKSMNDLLQRKIFKNNEDKSNLFFSNQNFTKKNYLKYKDIIIMPSSATSFLQIEKNEKIDVCSKFEEELIKFKLELINSYKMKSDKTPIMKITNLTPERFMDEIFILNASCYKNPKLIECCDLSKKIEGLKTIIDLSLFKTFEGQNTILIYENLLDMSKKCIGRKKLFNATCDNLDNLKNEFLLIFQKTADSNELINYFTKPSENFQTFFETIRSCPKVPNRTRRDSNDIPQPTPTIDPTRPNTVPPTGPVLNTEELKNCNNKVEEMQKEVKRLTDELTNINNELSKCLKKNQINDAECKEKINQMNNKITDLEKKVTDLEEKNKELNKKVLQLDDKLLALNLENNKLNEEIKKLNKDIKNLEIDYKFQISTMNTQIIIVQKELNLKIKENEKLIEENKKIKILEDEIQRLNKEIKTKDVEKQKLFDNNTLLVIKIKEKDGEISKLRDDLKISNDKNTDLEKKLTICGTNLKTCIEEKDNLKKEVESKNLIIKENIIQINILEKKIIEKEDDLQKCTKEKDGCFTNLDKEKNELKTIKEDLLNCTKEKVKLISRIPLLEEEIYELKKKNSDLSRKLEDAKGITLKFTSEINSLKIIYTENEKKIKELDKLMNDLKNQLENKTKDIKKLEQDLIECRNGNDCLQKLTTCNNQVELLKKTLQVCQTPKLPKIDDIKNYLSSLNQSESSCETIKEIKIQVDKICEKIKIGTNIFITTLASQFKNDKFFNEKKMYKNLNSGN